MAWADLVAGMDLALLGTFGVPTTYASPAAPAATVTGIFDAAYVPVDAGEAGVGSARPAVFYSLVTLPVDPADDYPTITVGVVDYQVTEVHKDGVGGVRLLLHRL